MARRTPATSSPSGSCDAAALALVPRLRFPEFREDPGWPVERLGQLFLERQESGYSELPLLSLTDRDGVIPQADTRRKNNSNVDKSKYLRVVPGDIAYNTMRMWEGRSALVALEGVVSPAYTVCQPDDGVHSPFYSFYFRAQPLISEFRRYSQGLVKDTLNLKYEAFAKIAVGHPAPAEQRKIADCLTSLDEVIAAQVRKVEALKAHKKGLMQNLFPREGGTVPRLRFPEFRDGLEWITKPLGDLFETMTGGTPDRAVPKYWGGSIPWVTTSLVDFNVIHDVEEFITEEGVEQSSAKRFPKDTVLVALYGQGKTRGKTAMLGIEATTNQACAAILPSPDIEPWFTFMSLAARYDEMRGLSNSGGQENLSQGLIRVLPFYYPHERAEQHRIAACLGLLDAVIANETAVLAALKAHKDGLMQQLFPAPEGRE